MSNEFVNDFFSELSVNTMPEVNPNGKMFIINKLSKGKWQAKYSDGSTKIFKTLKEARRSGHP